MTAPDGAGPRREAPRGAPRQGVDGDGADHPPPSGGEPDDGRPDVFAPWASPGGRPDGGARAQAGDGRPGPGRGAPPSGPSGDPRDRRADDGTGRSPGDVDRDGAGDEAATDAARRSLLFTLLVLCALVASRLPGLWASVGLAFTATAMVVGGLAVASAWTARRRGTVAVMGGGLALAAFLLMTQVAQLVVHPFQAELRDCLASAVTVETRAACQEADRQRLTELLEGVGGGAGPTGG